MSEPASTNPQSITAGAGTLEGPQPGQPKPKLSQARKRRRNRRIAKGVVWALLLCAVAAGGWWYFTVTQQDSAETDAVAYTRAPVREGAFDVYVYGSGSITAASQPVVYAETDGKLAELRVAVGDKVTKGQVLAVLQNDALSDEIASLEYDLWNADNNITTTAPGSSVSSIQAPSTGRVMQISAAVGDDALAVYRRLGSVAMLSTDGRMKVELDVAEGVALSYGDPVTVTGEGFTREGSVTDLFLQGTRAVITVVDDSLPMGAPVTVTYQGVTLGQGELAINKPMAVSAFGGTIQAVRVSVGDTVHRKQDIFLLEDSPVTLTVENLRIQRETAAEALEEARNRRENLIMLSPVDGVIATVELAEGADMVAGDALLSILEGEDMVLTIAVDELDVVNVAEGQAVNISVDALPDLVLAGTVDRIAPVGTGESGVSTYDV
jgi:HlyD family secretion protein